MKYFLAFMFLLAAVGTSYGQQSQRTSITSKIPLATATESGLVKNSEGSYTPTLTNTANVDVSTAYVTYYSQVGKTVTVFGIVDIDPSASGTIDLRMTTPSGLNIAAAGSAPAAGTAVNGLGDALSIDKITTATVRFTANPATRTNNTYRFNFTYRMD